MGEPALVCRMKGEWISMKKFKIKTNLVSGIIMGVIALILILCIPSQIRVPAYDSGAPSPRIIPGICLAIMLVSSIALLIQSYLGFPLFTAANLHDGLLDCAHKGLVLAPL